ncbi:hypothetical protein CW706_01465 [Candidatus Bathyarchaeota archaeon]|nr:MAG: hypothetical protein CW706_01465 [Candidatus Bathyarchaeota archaeon]
MHMPIINVRPHPSGSAKAPQFMLHVEVRNVDSIIDMSVGPQCHAGTKFKTSASFIAKLGPIYSAPVTKLAVQGMADQAIPTKTIANITVSSCMLKSPGLAAFSNAATIETQNIIDNGRK